MTIRLEMEPGLRTCPRRETTNEVSVVARSNLTAWRNVNLANLIAMAGTMKLGTLNSHPATGILK